MKYLSALIVFTVIFFAGSAYAQSPAATGGKSYTYVMKNIDGSGVEIIDQITFNGNSVTSEKFSSTGFKAGKMTQKSADNGASNFEVTLQSDTEGSVKMSGVLTDGTIDGTLISTDTNGAQTTMAIRGISTTEWNNLQKAKKEYKETQK